MNDLSSRVPREVLTPPGSHWTIKAAVTRRSILNEPTLVLNRSWYAVATTTVRHAIRLMFVGASRAVSATSYETHSFDTWVEITVPPDELCIRTVSMRILKPEVIVLTHYDGVPNKSLPFTRRSLFKRDRHTCQYCGTQPGVAQLTIDHVMPRSRGGRTTWTNCVLACVPCNLEKGSRTPGEARMSLGRTPEPPPWTHALEIPTGGLPESWTKFVSAKLWGSIGA